MTTHQLFEGDPVLLIARDDDVDIHALRRQDWPITAIAHHVRRERKTVRDYANGRREPGVRQRPEDPFAPFLSYMVARLVEDPHLWCITVFDELQALDFTASDQTLTRQIRVRHLRAVCTDCGRATERANAVIPHLAGQETQWHWLKPPDPPQRPAAQALLDRRPHRFVSSSNMDIR